MGEAGHYNTNGNWYKEGEELMFIEYLLCTRPCAQALTQLYNSWPGGIIILVLQVGKMRPMDVNKLGWCQPELDPARTPTKPPREDREGSSFTGKRRRAVLQHVGVVGTGGTRREEKRSEQSVEGEVGV